MGGVLDEVEGLEKKEPFSLFQQWRKRAKTECPTTFYAMSLATVSPEGTPSNRMMKLEYASAEDGFVFSTFSNSSKAVQLAHNPNAAMCFWWEGHVVRIEGVVEEMSRETSLALFRRIPPICQKNVLLIGTRHGHTPGEAIPWTETGGSIDADKCLEGEELTRFMEEELKLGKELAHPNWRSYRLIPKSVEFRDGKPDWTSVTVKFRQMKQGETVHPQKTFQGADGWIYERQR